MIGIRSHLIVRPRLEAQGAGRRIDGEQRGVGSTGDRIADRRTVGVRRRHRRNGGRILIDRDRGGSASSVGGNDRRGPVRHVAHGDGQALGVHAAIAIIGGDDQLIDIIAIRIRRVFKVGRGQKAQFSRHGIDSEQRRVGTSSNRKANGLASVRIRCGNGGHRHAIFIDGQRGARATAIGCDHRRCVKTRRWDRHIGELEKFDVADRLRALGRSGTQVTGNIAAVGLKRENIIRPVPGKYQRVDVGATVD